MREELAAREKLQALSDNDPVCPDCKTRMVLRIAQRGPVAGSKFWGCPNYPGCRATISLDKK
ncbi:MAG: topoisomerase DNA-binding C4 zinc finger domain-containing protein [Elusimicrobiota bacterium]|nr:topoisomerase DNA-binding C4 zinc finger domain-containing protein [Elusimicrobiota bacterium]